MLRAYQDKNQTAGGSQALTANQAVIFRWGSRTYMSVNDGTSSFSKDTDLMIDITGAALLGGDSTAGTLVVSNYFA